MLALELGTYVQFQLRENICAELKRVESVRYDAAALNNRCVKGIIKAVYTDDTTKLVYVELVGVVVNSPTSAYRKEYVVLETDVEEVVEKR